MFFASGISRIADSFGVEWPMLIAQIVNFCIVAYVLYRFAFKPVLRTIDERQRRIADGLQYAEEMKRQLAEAERKRNETIKEASLSARKIIEEAKDAAEDYGERQKKEVELKAESILQKARQEIESEHQKMLTDIRREVATLVVQVTGKVIDKDLSEKEKARISESAAEQIASI